MKKILLASLCMLMAVLTVPVEAAFPAKGHDTFITKAKFRIVLDGGAYMDTPILVDDTTTALRSDPHTEGTEPPWPGATVGGTSGLAGDNGFRTVHDNLMTFPDGWTDEHEGQPSRREIHTELYSLFATGGGITLKAGAYHITTRSVGEVSSLDSTGSTDFPADSFFDIYFEVDIPGPPGITLYNKPGNPLILKNGGINALPPLASGYVHDFGGKNWAVPLHIKGNGQFFGWLTKGVHGVGVSDGWLEGVFEALEDGEPHGPIPTLSEWGLIVMALLFLMAGAIVIKRRRRVTAIW